VLWSYLLVPFLIPTKRGDISWPVRTRLAVERLGGTWVKFAQVLALRFDLLPAAYCYEFYKLLNKVPPFSYTQVREVIRHDLGDYPETLFRSFEPEPFASASVGQVHRAVLHSAERVAVKVQRPGIRDLIRTDLNLMYAMAGIIDRTRLFGHTSTRAVIDELARWAMDELDYTIEARHASVLYQNAHGDPLERIPKVYWKHTSPRVLTLEFLEGIPLVVVLQAVWDGDTEFLEDFKARGHDLEVIARHIDWNMLNQMHVNGYFHADIHPANLIVMPGNEIGYVDFGIVGVLTDEVRESLIQYTWYFHQGKAERAVAQLARWIKPSRWTNVEAAHRDLTRLHEEFRMSLDDPGPKAARDTASQFAVSILTKVRQHAMVMSPNVMAYVRTVVTADTLRSELAPNYEFLRYVELYFSRFISQQARGWLDPRRLVAGAFEYSFRARHLIDFVEAQQETVEALSATFTTTRRSAQTVGAWVRLVGILALVAGAIFLVVRADPGILEGRPGTRVSFDWFSIGLMVVLVVLAIVIAVQSVQLRGEEERESQVQQTLRAGWQQPTRRQ
jgi:ubiquinone biosynthesis protein